MQKLILTAAITGAELDKKKCPVLPITPEEQGIAAKECVDAGVSIIHLHVRDDNGQPSQTLEHFKRSVDAIRKACGDKMPIIQFSSGGAVGESMDNRIAPLALKPEMASFNMGTINFGDEIFANTFPDMRLLSAAFKKSNVVPEFEVYDLGHLDNLRKLAKEGVISAPFHVQFVLGVPGALSGEPQHLMHLVANLPENSTWGVAGIGRYQLPLAVHALVMGGNVRIGLEDNIYYSKGVVAKSNAELAKRISRIAAEINRPVATIDEARQILELR